jgi:integrase
MRRSCKDTIVKLLRNTSSTLISGQRVRIRATLEREVTAHGMRGLHSSLALAAGTSSHIVAASLGHESIATTLQSYADPSAVSDGKQQVVLHVLEGGK